MAKPVRILGLCGSLRAQSYNRAALLFAQKAVPKNATLSIYEGLGDLPLYNQDLDGKVPAVTKLKKAIEESDAILYSIPEYNYGVPGVIKNAIDWASRPYGQNSFQYKPAGIMSASIGMLGGARAQYQLRQCFVFLQQPAIMQPEIFLANAASKFDKSGELTDETSKKLITGYLQTLVDFTLQQKPKPKL